MKKIKISDDLTKALIALKAKQTELQQLIKDHGETAKELIEAAYPECINKSWHLDMSYSETGVAFLNVHGGCGNPDCESCNAADETPEETPIAPEAAKRRLN